MSRRAQENLISILLLVVFAGVIVLCQDFGARARMIPLPLAILGIVLTLIQIAWHNFGSADELHMDMISVQTPVAPAGDAPAPEKKSPWRREVAAYIMVGMLVAVVFLTGLIPAVFLFTATYFMLTHYCSWWRALVYSAILTASVYVLFVVALEIQPYHGLLAPYFN